MSYANLSILCSCFSEAQQSAERAFVSSIGVRCVPQGVLGKGESHSISRTWCSALSHALLSALSHAFLSRAIHCKCLSETVATCAALVRYPLVVM